MPVPRSAILKAAARIKERDKVDDAEALRRAEAWAKKKNLENSETPEMRETRLKAEGKCILPIEVQRGGKISPRCPCPQCGGPGGDMDAKHKAADRAYRASSGNW